MSASWKKLKDEMKPGITSYLRVKPSSPPGEASTLTIVDEQTVLMNDSKHSKTHQFSFSKVFNPETSQKELFDECIAPQVKDFILGSNSLIFAHGTTNAGKTHTIQGNAKNPGLIPRAIDALFKNIQGQVAGVGQYKPHLIEDIEKLDPLTIKQELDYKEKILHWKGKKPVEPIKAGSDESPNSTGSSESDFISNTYREMQKTLCTEPFDVHHESEVVYGVWISFAEVYNESVFDLLDPMLTKNSKRIPLKLGEDAEGNVYIRDLKMIHVSSGDEAFHIMQYGKANLQVAGTNLNMRSSRSHCIFTIRLVRYANPHNPAIVSSFTFCDLAGAERAKKTMNSDKRLTESNKINLSLLALGRCLTAIRDNQHHNLRNAVPFRGSKITRIFRRALIGNERLTMIVAANTAPILYDETLNVLDFSAVAKQIVRKTPIKKVKPKKKSRFSIMATQPIATVCWDAPPQEADTSTSTVASTDDGKQKYNAQNEALILLVDKLRSQLQEEREKNLNLERVVRESVTQTFSKIVPDLEKSSKTSVENFCQLEKLDKLENPRKRPRRNSEGEDSKLVWESPDTDKDFELEFLEEKCSAMHDLLREAQDMQSSLASEVSSLKFELANTKADLEKRQLAASDKQADGLEASLSDELQLKLTAEIKKNENLRALLNEAKDDTVWLNQEKEAAEKQLDQLEREALQKDEEISLLSRNVRELSQLLSEMMWDGPRQEDNREVVQAQVEDVSNRECKPCKKVYSSHSMYMRHVREYHLQLKPIACKFCPKRFRRNELLRKHVVREHPAAGEPTGTAATAATSSETSRASNSQLDLQEP